MKLNITIESEKMECEIVEIEINNGNWKYNDDHMETDEKISLTINTFNQARYLGLPVKDTYDLYDHELYQKTGELKVKRTIIRRYDTLLEYLNCRINNFKEDCKKSYLNMNGTTYECYLCDEENYVSRDETLETPIVYNSTYRRFSDRLNKLTVRMEVIE